MGPENAKKVLDQFKPKIAVPMHYYNNTAMLERFMDGPYQTRFLENNKFSISKHWNRGGHIGGTKWEIYNNTFIGGAWAAAGGMPGRFQAGTGVIYNNSVTGYGLGWKVDELRGCGQESGSWLLACDGTHAWDGNIESNGWPCLNQIGRATGISLDPVTHAKSGMQASQPAYSWNNGAQATCASGGNCTDSVTISRYNPCPANVIQSTAHSKGEFDYVNNGSTPMPGYAPYVYPHPLQHLAHMIPPAAPSGLSVQ
jgi:hypothetical protein